LLQSILSFRLCTNSRQCDVDDFSPVCWSIKRYIVPLTIYDSFFTIEVKLFQCSLPKGGRCYCIVIITAKRCLGNN
jgi:hypothetical protein